MTAQAPPPSDRDAAQDTQGPDGSPDRDLEILRELAEIGLGVAAALGRQARGAPAADAPPPARPHPAPSNDDAAAPDMAAIALAYCRVSRAVRQAVLLHAKLTEDRRASAQAAASRAELDALERPDHVAARIAQVERIAQRVAMAHDESDREDDLHGASIERLVAERCERLDDDDIYDVLAHPVSETIALICRDLCLAPDWPRLAEEAWAQAELQSDAVGAPLAALRTGSGGGTRERPAPKPIKPPGRWPRSASP